MMMSSQRRDRHIFDNPEALGRGAAELFCDAAMQAIQARGSFHVVLSGGSTPRLMYGVLASPPFLEQVAWDRVHFFWGDERPVPPEDSESNFHSANRALLRHLDLAADQIHRMRGEETDLDHAARGYQNEVARVFNTDPGGAPPSFDLIFLGMGGDGHTASLFPHTKALGESARWVVANEVPQLATRRLTMTEPILNAARRIAFLVSGADKAETLRKVMEGPRDADRLPAQRISPGSGELVWMMDRDAASWLG